MLSKLAISLVLVLILTLLTGPASAQIFHLSVAAGTDGAPLADGEFLVFEMPANVGSAANGINRNDVTVETPSDAWQNLVEFFEFGGTVELWEVVDNNLADDEVPSTEDTTTMVQKLIISEIMWGVDLSAPRKVGDVDVMPAGLQWIEIYNGSGETKGGAAGVKGALYLYFHENEKLNRLGTTIDLDGDDDGLADSPEDFTVLVVDQVSTVGKFGRQWDLKGSSGRIVPDTTRGVAASNMVSMYRKGAIKDGKYELITDGDDKGNIKDLKDGAESDAWEVSKGRANMSGRFIGSPGSVHVGVGGVMLYERLPNRLPATGVIINEIRNDTAAANVDWVELHNTGGTDVVLKKWRLDRVDPATKDTGNKMGYHQETIVEFPDEDYAMIPAGDYLLIVNQHPSDTVLAGGVNIADPDGLPKGARHRYFVADHKDATLDLPADGKFLLVLRNGNDRTNHEKIVDIAGNQLIADTGTEVSPLQGWEAPSGDNFDRSVISEDITSRALSWARKGSNPERFHKDDWEKVGAKGGIGYDHGVDLSIAPGTPGYANNVVKNKSADVVGGNIVISEIMFDTGENRRFVQWIEIYNASMREAVDLTDWELEIRNMNIGVAFFVNASFKFKTDTIILPNQILLLVSNRSGVTNVPRDRVYNLYQNHRAVLGLLNRQSVLLSSEGFYLRLTDTDGNVVDEAGNLMLDGPRRNKMWDLPETGGGMRYSIVRKGGSPIGTEPSAWVMAQADDTYYGHRSDVGTPGHRLGSPLPVSLSSFRPVRDKTTGQVVITWVTESELNNAGFNILRSNSRGGDFKVINPKLLAGHGTTSERHVYTYVDTTAKPNAVYYYRIEDVSFDGKRTTLRTTHLRGDVTPVGKLTTMWGGLKLLSEPGFTGF